MVSQENLTLALAGLVIVFAVLALVATAVGLIRRLDDRWQAKEAAAVAAAGERPPTIDHTTLVLIAATVTTVLVGRHRIRRIRRLLSPEQPRTPWSAQGRLVLQGSHTLERGRERS